jgi:hypothetical protein
VLPLLPARCALCAAPLLLLAGLLRSQTTSSALLPIALSAVYSTIFTFEQRCFLLLRC